MNSAADLRKRAAVLWSLESAPTRALGFEERAALASVAAAVLGLLPKGIKIEPEERALVDLLASPDLTQDEKQGAIARSAAPRGAVVRALLSWDALEVSMMYLAMIGGLVDPEFALGRLADHIKLYRTPIIRNTIDEAAYKKDVTALDNV